MSQPPPVPGQVQTGFVPAPPKTNVAAVISLICGILGCVPLVTSLAALVLGFVGIGQAKKLQGGGKGLAISGVILGALGVLGWAAFALSIVLGVNRFRQITSERVERALAIVAAQGMRVPPDARPTPAEKYEILIGEELSGSGFLISHDGNLWGICSLHQFDKKTPATFIQLDGDDVELNPQAVIKQRDVQAIGVVKAPADIQFLAYQPRFELREGDEVIIFGPAGERIAGTLSSLGPGAKEYNSTKGPRTMIVSPSKPFMITGASGGPIILKRTGAVIGVLLSSDSRDNPTEIGIETLCMPEKRIP